jgi:hypothetical protein
MFTRDHYPHLDQLSVGVGLADVDLRVVLFLYVAPAVQALHLIADDWLVAGEEDLLPSFGQRSR